LEVVDDDSIFGRPIPPARAEDHDPNIVWPLWDRFEKGGHEKLDQEGVAEMVGAEVDLVAILGQALRNQADRGIAKKEIKTRRDEIECVCCSLDRSERGEIARYEGDLGVWSFASDVLHCCHPRDFIAREYEDVCIALCKSVTSCLSNTAGP
jgi:hypothetical protein